MSPRPSPEEIRELYSDSYYLGESQYNYHDERSNQEANAFIHRNRLKVLEKFINTANGKKRLLDIGCAFGGLLEMAGNLQWETFGLEISGYAARYAAEEKGMNVSNESIEEAELGEGSIDAAIMIEVIEHLQDPAKALAKINRALDKNGILMVQTANADSLKAKTGGADWEYFLPGHLFCFSRKTLKQLLEKTGFEIVHIFTGDELSIRSKIGKLRADSGGTVKPLQALKLAFKHFARKIPLGNLSVGGNVFIARKIS